LTLTQEAITSPLGSIGMVLCKNMRKSNMALEGQAATYVDSSEVLRAIVSRAGRDSATPEDLADFQRALTDRYHPNFVDEPALTSSNFEMCQGDDEPLFSYHTRVVSLLRRAGGRDKPSGDDTGISSCLERHCSGQFGLRMLDAASLANSLEGRLQGVSSEDILIDGFLQGFVGKTLDEALDEIIQNVFLAGRQRRIITRWLVSATSSAQETNHTSVIGKQGFIVILTLSTSEKYILNDFIQRFIQGLADKSLMQEAINQNVLAADTLKSAFERIRQAGCIQHAKTELARAVARDTKISLFHHPMACLCHQLGARVRAGKRAGSSTKLGW
ncbi:hypothetical protein E4U19_003106, partial [Claviceps sp. Clav32 group G5]